MGYQFFLLFTVRPYILLRVYAANSKYIHNQLKKKLKYTNLQYSESRGAGKQIKLKLYHDSPSATSPPSRALAGKSGPPRAGVSGGVYSSTNNTSAVVVRSARSAGCRLSGPHSRAKMATDLHAHLAIPTAQ